MTKITTNRIPDGWEEKTLGDVLILHYGKSLSQTNRILGSVPVYGSSGITGWHNEPLTDSCGVIIGRKGTIGSVHKSDVPFFPIDTVYYLTEADTKCDFGFLYYFLTNFGLSEMNSDSAVPGLNRNNVYSRETLLPPRSEQKSIADVLSSLDDKIELLRKQNETLEVIAQTIFKEWFVNFNFPDKNGKPYNDSGGKMIDSELGEIPEGWRVGTVGDEFDIVMGQSPPGSSYNQLQDGEVFFQGRTDFGERFPKTRLYTTDPKRMAEPFDVLVSVRAPVGDINVSAEKCCIGRGLGAVRGKYRSYTLYKMKHLQEALREFEAEGTVFGSIGKDDFNNIDVVVPVPEFVKSLDNTIAPIDEKIFNSHNQMQTLTELRDRLLPKLMSGQVRVKT